MVPPLPFRWPVKVSQSCYGDMTLRKSLVCSRIVAIRYSCRMCRFLIRCRSPTIWPMRLLPAGICWWWYRVMSLVTCCSVLNRSCVPTPAWHGLPKGWSRNMGACWGMSPKKSWANRPLWRCCPALLLRRNWLPGCRPRLPLQVQTSSLLRICLR